MKEYPTLITLAIKNDHFNLNFPVNLELDSLAIDLYVV